MAKKKRSETIKPQASEAASSPEANAYHQLYMRIAERLGILTQMIRYAKYSLERGTYRSFLESADAYNEPVDESGVKEEWGAYYLEVIHHTIVMLHATTEDVVRTLSRWHLPRCEAEVLKKIPIARADGASDSKLKELGQLIPHRNASVEQLLRTSIDSWLDRQTFNSSQQVAGMLQKIGISTDSIKNRLKSLDTISGLRHQIAHTGEIKEQELDKLLDGPELVFFIREIYLFSRTLLVGAMPKAEAVSFNVYLLLQEEMNKRRGLELGEESIAARISEAKEAEN